MEQTPLRDYKPEISKYPLVEVFSAWLKTVDLSKLTSDMYKLLMATHEYNISGFHPGKHKMSDDQKRAVMLLQQDNFVVLSLRDQLDYYGQIVRSEFRKSVDELTTQTEILAKSESGNTGK
jgi:hypothetical protein